MGKVYRARDTSLHRQVAIKVLALHIAGDPLMAARFDRALEWFDQAIKPGYSIKRTERSPWLKDLRADERYHQLTR